MRKTHHESGQKSIIHGRLMSRSISIAHIIMFEDGLPGWPWVPRCPHCSKFLFLALQKHAAACLDSTSVQTSCSLCNSHVSLLCLCNRTHPVRCRSAGPFVVPLGCRHDRRPYGLQVRTSAGFIASTNSESKGAGQDGKPASSRCMARSAAMPWILNINQLKSRN